MNETKEEREARLETASRFVAARRAAEPLAAYPGTIPPTLEAAYAIQKAAIGMWPDEVAGWKVGRIVGEAEKAFGCDRLAGPIFRRNVFTASRTGATRFPIFEGGFAAVEAEFIVVVGKDAPAGKTKWSRAEAKAMIGSVLAGVEIAGSPFPGINDFGPTVTISDFGNNGGLIIDGEYRGWRDFDFESWKCEAYIGGNLAGANDASSIPGGPIESFRFLLENSARMGMPLKEGQYVSTGAITGVHAIEAGQVARLAFVGFGAIDCAAIPAVAALDKDARVAAAT